MMNRSTTIGMSILLIQNLMTTTLAVRYSIIAMAGMAIDDVRYATMTMLFINSSLKYHLLMANMILVIFLGNWLLNKNLHAFNFLTSRVRAATSEFSDFAFVWWVEYGTKHPNDIPQSWIALKRVMRARFVPSYYARDLINKLQQLKQGAKSVEEYYQELQIGMLRCNLEEREDAAMARFFADLNREIQDILEYKDYANITRLFHFACKAEREVQGRHASANTNFSTGRTNSWQRNNGRTTTPSPSPSRVATSTSNNNSKPRAAATNSATRAPSATKSTPPPAESTASSSRARDMQCHRCKGFGHVMRDCPSKRVLVVRDDGEYSSASDFNEDTLALLAD
jgi:hypothetical protein